MGGAGYLQCFVVVEMSFVQLLFSVLHHCSTGPGVSAFFKIVMYPLRMAAFLYAGFQLNSLHTILFVADRSVSGFPRQRLPRVQSIRKRKRKRRRRMNKRRRNLHNNNQRNCIRYCTVGPAYYCIVEMLAA